MLRRALLPLVSIAFALVFASGAQAVSYGNFIDPSGTVQYLNVADVNGLFGAPSVSLNSLDFTPTAFQAQCSQCPDGVSVTDLLTLDILASAGQQVDTIEITEGLDWAIQSFDPSGFAAVTVSANIFIDILEVNGATVNGINASASVVYSPSSVVSFSGFALPPGGTITGTTGSIDIGLILANAGVLGDATRVRISLDNTLTAFHLGSGGLARIRKRDADFVSLTVNGGNPIPEPTTAVLLMGGLAILASRRREG